VFGRNEIVGKKYFVDADNKLLVTSIFYTIQGEGPLMGEPAIFVRLAKCNLACSFCDTYFDSGQWMTYSEIVDGAEQAVIRELGEVPTWMNDNPPALILTGGEPTLQDINSLLLGFINAGSATQIESNGILEAAINPLTIFVISPKCAEKNGKTGKYIKPHPKNLERADALKFVLSADPESQYHTIPEWAFEWKEKRGYGARIFVSPMNIYNEEPQTAKTARISNETSLEQRSTIEEVISFWTPGLLNQEQNQRNHEYVREYAKKNGLQVNLQMHLYLGAA
jgi:organic radical activating enzyme